MDIYRYLESEPVIILEVPFTNSLFSRYAQGTSFIPKELLCNLSESLLRIIL